MKNLLTVFVLFAFQVCWSQYKPPPERLNHDVELPPLTIKFFPSEVRPEFPGSKEDMLRFIELRFQFSPDMLIGQSEYQLACNLQVDVSETGKILKVHDWNHREIEPEVFGPDGENIRKGKILLFRELKRIFLLMPNWIPGKTKGENVKASTVIYYEKPLFFPYGNGLHCDHLVYDDNGQLDTAHIYEKPQVKPKEMVGSQEYFYQLSLNFEYPDELLKDSIITSYGYEFIVDEDGNPYNFKQQKRQNQHPLLDSLAFEHIKQLPQYEPASIDGVPVKCPWRIGFFIYPPHYVENDLHRMRKKRVEGRYYQTRDQGLRKYFEENFQYPEQLVENPILGTVFVALEANEDGSLKYCYVLSGIDPAIDEDVVRVFKKSTDWTYIHSDRPFVQGKAIIVAMRISERHLP